MRPPMRDTSSVSSSIVVEMGWGRSFKERARTSRVVESNVVRARIP